MKERNKHMRLEAVGAGKKTYTYYHSFRKKDNAVRNIEIIVACIIAFLAGTGIYQVLQ